METYKNRDGRRGQKDSSLRWKLLTKVIQKVTGSCSCHTPKSGRHEEEFALIKKYEEVNISMTFRNKCLLHNNILYCVFIVKFAN